MITLVYNIGRDAGIEVGWLGDRYGVAIVSRDDYPRMHGPFAIIESHDWHQSLIIARTDALGSVPYWKARFWLAGRYAALKAHVYQFINRTGHLDAPWGQYPCWRDIRIRRQK